MSTGATRITPGVQAALLADPTVNYIILIYDSMSQFVVPAVTITSSQTLEIDAFNGTPFVLGLLQQGQVEMDIGKISTGSATRSSTPKCAACVACL